MEKMAFTYEEFYNLANQLYPDQCARVFAELRAAKLEARVAELLAERQDDAGPEPAAQVAP